MSVITLEGPRVACTLHMELCVPCWHGHLNAMASALPDHIDERRICNAVSPSKDVDGFHVVNVGRMCLDQSTMLPATPWGVMEIIKRTGKW